VIGVASWGGFFFFDTPVYCFVEGKLPVKIKGHFISYIVLL
jgi:hypothetical protein